VLAGASDHLVVIAQRLERARSSSSYGADPRPVMAALGDAFKDSGYGEATSEAILQADELALALVERTRLQEQLVEVYCDFAEVRFPGAGIIRLLY